MINTVPWIKRYKLLLTLKKRSCRAGNFLQQWISTRIQQPHYLHHVAAAQKNLSHHKCSKLTVKRKEDLSACMPVLPKLLHKLYVTPDPQVLHRWAHAVKGTHLLAAMVSTEPGEGLHVGKWPPSLSPSRSQMSLSSPKLQVLSPASLSGVNKALRKKEGKWARAGKKTGTGCETGLCVIG